MRPLIIILFFATGLTPFCKASTQDSAIRLELNIQQVLNIKGANKPNTNYLIIPHVNDSIIALKFIYPRLEHVRVVNVNNGKSNLIYQSDGLLQGNKEYINYIIPIENNLRQNDTLRIDISNSFPLKLPVIIENVKVSITREHDYELWFSLYTGILMVMIFYNLFVFASTKDKIYFLYIIYIVAVLFTQLSIFGFTAKFLWPGNEWLNYQAVNIFTVFVGIASIEFIKHFNRMNEYYPAFSKMLDVLSILYICALLYSVISIKNISNAYNLISIVASLLGVLAFISGFLIIKKGYKPAKFFLVAWSMFIIGVVLYIMKDFGILKVNFLTKYTMPIGSALETVILSLALADRINILKKEKEESQAQTLIEMQKNQELIKEQNILLEQRVTERTSELNETLTNLRETQQQLLESEKMASLGQLTAGIAHEINNPINFVSSNIEPLKADIKDVLDILHQYKQKAASLNLSEFKSIADYEKEIDLEYTITEIDKLMSGIKEGAGRTTEIVNSLRTFSRNDENVNEIIDLAQLIESSILILKNGLGKINVEKHFEKLPEMRGNAGKLNQVFINVINNAIQAINEKYAIDQQGVIAINISKNEDFAVVSIADNGPGIPDEIVSRIFDPFFTTKEVGKGTGLGLSITYGIIEQHKGKIRVEKPENGGTNMIIELPLKKE